MKLSDLSHARAVAKCLDEIKEFEKALDSDDVVYLKMFRTTGSDGDDPEYHLGGIPVVADLIKNERRSLEAKAEELGLELDK